jgi:purine nucleosidase
MKIILDTDIGTDIDDAYALAFAVRHRDIDVKAVTTVHAYPVERAQLVEHLLTLAGRPEIPVRAGWSLPIHPLDHEQQQAYLARRPNHTQVASGTGARFRAGEAVSLILETVDQYAGDIALVTIGPLTNIAAALAADPGLPRKVTCIAMMAGELNRNHLEYNVRLDPRAADMVFRCGARMFVATWEISRRLVLLPDHLERLRQNGDRLAAELVRCTDLWWPHRGAKPGPVLYDLSPLLWLLDPSWFVTRPTPLRVETENPTLRGMTYEALSGADSVQVTTDFRDPDKAREILLGLLGRPSGSHVVDQVAR